LDGIGVQAVGGLRPEEKISPALWGALAAGSTATVVAEFYVDVDPNDGRAIVNDAGLLIEQNPDLLSNHLLVTGGTEQLLSLAGWDEVSYIFPASADLLARRPVRACAGALTVQGTVGQSVALIGPWNGASQRGANLSYAWVHLTEALPPDSVETEIERAFSEWAKYAKLTFTPASNATQNQTIAVLFASGDHGDGYPFVPQGGVLAHTFYPYPINPEPIAGDMHFNNDENWKIGATVDVFSIALHEAGHALGLGHSDNPGAVMYPYYHQATALSQEDIDAILQLYAPQDAQPSPGAPSGTPTNQLTLKVQVPASPTTAASIGINGTATGGLGSIQVAWASGSGSSGTAQGSLSWSIPSVPLNVGANLITITARDSQQALATQSFTIIRDQIPNPAPPNPATPTPGNPSPNPTPGPETTPPSITILSPAMTNFATSASSLVVQGTAQDNVGVALVTWASSNGESGKASGTNNWITPPIPLYVGATTITIRASDAAGNTSWRSLTVIRN
jgi:hypothetical protein